MTEKSNGRPAGRSNNRVNQKISHFLSMKNYLDPDSGNGTFDPDSGNGTQNLIQGMVLLTLIQGMVLLHFLAKNFQNFFSKIA
jgi:hypothetical protein